MKSILVILLLSAAAYIEAQETNLWDAIYFPNPMKTPSDCKRNHRSTLCDPNGLLKDEEANMVEKRMMKLTNSTACPCDPHSCFDQKGYKVGVALVKQLKNPELPEFGTGLHQKLMIARRFAYQVKFRWAFGKCDEEVMIVYSKKDNVLYTVVGDKAAEKLNSELISSISLEANKYFEQAEIYLGLKYLIESYELVFQGKRPEQMN